MEVNKNIKIQFPNDDSNKIYDGKIHTVTPVELESILIGNNKFYILRYTEENQSGITLLGTNKDRQFFKIPLDNYDYLFNYLESAYTQRETLTALNNQNYINTIGIQNVEQLFSNNNSHKEQKTIAASLEPPIPPKTTASQEPPKPLIWKMDIPETVQSKTAGASQLPPNSSVTNEGFEKEVKLYIGIYGSSYAVYREIDRKEKDIEDNKFRFGRNLENKKLSDSIIKFLSASFSGQESDEIYIDYGKDGEETHLIDTDLINLTDSVDEEEYERLYGKYKYKIITSEFVNIEDFNKFKSSVIVECMTTDNMYLRFSPETHSTIFLSLASSDVIAKFQDSYGNTDVNNFSEKSDMRVHKSK